MSRIQENKKYYLFENLTGKEDHSCCFYYDLRKDGMIFHFDVEDEDIVNFSVAERRQAPLFGD